MVEDVARTVHIARQLGEPLPDRPGRHRRLYDRYQNVYGQQSRRTVAVTDRRRPRDLVPHREPGPYGEETLRQVAEQSQQVAEALDASATAAAAGGLEAGADRRRRRSGATMLEANADDRVHRRDRLDAHVLAGQDVDRRARRAAQAAAAPAHPGQRRAAVGRRSTWTS